MTTRSRWIGFAGATLLTAGSYGAGALPGAAPASQSEALWGDGPAFRVGLAACLVGLVALGWAWWRLGVVFRAGDPPRLRWVLLTGVLWAAPLLVAAPLGSRDVYAYACQGAGWLDGHDPYTTGAASGGCAWTSAVPDLWQDTTAPYGPLALVISAAAVALARAVATGDAAQLLVTVGALRAAALAGMLLVAGFGPRLARACGVSPAVAAWLGLVTPLVGVHAIAGAHNDALVAGLVIAALALACPPAQIRNGSWLVAGAGVALGLAAAVKVTALAALPFVALLALVSAGRRRAVVAVLAAAVGAFAGLTIVTGLGLGWLAALPDTGALVQWSSLPSALGMAAGYGLWALGWPGLFDTAVAVARAAGLVALVVAASALLVWAWRRRGETRVVVTAAGAVLAAVVLLAPVVYPWYALAPLAVLAAAVSDPRARAWLVVATLVLTALVLPSGLGVPVLTKLPGALLVTAALMAVSWWWLRRLRRPGRPHPQPTPPPERPARAR